MRGGELLATAWLKNEFAQARGTGVAPDEGRFGSGAAPNPNGCVCGDCCDPICRRTIRQTVTRPRCFVSSRRRRCAALGGAAQGPGRW